jgi:CheY-like chemotaxis protein
MVGPRRPAEVRLFACFQADNLSATRIANSVKRVAFGLVLSDWNMQPMTGPQLRHAVRTTLEIAATPFIMITGEAARERLTARSARA